MSLSIGIGSKLHWVFVYIMVLIVQYGQGIFSEDFHTLL